MKRDFELGCPDSLADIQILRNQFLRLHIGWLAVILVSGPALAGVVWRGDFETGDHSQYSGAQMVRADRLAVVTSPVGEGQYALKATVKQGDDPIDASGNRNELVYLSNEQVGSEYYYRWKVMFAPDFPSVKTWQVFTQWHHDGCCGSPPVEFFVYGEEMRLTLTDSITPWKAPLTRGVWHEFVFHVKWSPEPKEGFVELWHNGQLALKKQTLATMYKGMKSYMKLGLYRSDTIKETGVVYHDGFIQATALEDVMPPPPPPAPAPEEDPKPEPPKPEVPPVVQVPETAPGEGLPAEETSPGVTPGLPGTVSPSVPGISEEMTSTHGCSTPGGPLTALVALLGLLGRGRSRRRR
ncbi:polysaccharide lyase [Stigmatella erecta]|uniref:polysaccharide lyase n=1 Tax=Stigmatella erecta TaxID=83460 RepID=UPI000B871C62|nr:polysaccharide lyase [Stigmatella erecta]